MIAAAECAPLEETLADAADDGWLVASVSSVGNFRVRTCRNRTDPASSTRLYLADPFLWAL